MSGSTHPTPLTPASDPLPPMLEEAQAILDANPPVEPWDVNPVEFLTDLSHLGQDDADVHAIVLDMYVKYRSHVITLMAAAAADILLEHYTKDSIREYLAALGEAHVELKDAAYVIVVATSGLPDALAVALLTAQTRTWEPGRIANTVHELGHFFNAEPFRSHLPTTEEVAEYKTQWAEYTATHTEAQHDQEQTPPEAS